MDFVRETASIIKRNLQLRKKKRAIESETAWANNYLSCLREKNPFVLTNFEYVSKKIYRVTPEEYFTTYLERLVKLYNDNRYLEYANRFEGLLQPDIIATIISPEFKQKLGIYAPLRLLITKTRLHWYTVYLLRKFSPITMDEMNALIDIANYGMYHFDIRDYRGTFYELAIGSAYINFTNGIMRRKLKRNKLFNDDYDTIYLRNIAETTSKLIDDQKICDRKFRNRQIKIVNGLVIRNVPDQGGPLVVNNIDLRRLLQESQLRHREELLADQHMQDMFLAVSDWYRVIREELQREREEMERIQEEDERRQREEEQRILEEEQQQQGFAFFADLHVNEVFARNRRNYNIAAREANENLRHILPGIDVILNKNLWDLSSTEDYDGNDNCPICLDPLKGTPDPEYNTDKNKELYLAKHKKCRLYVHLNCIETGYRTNPQCPICKQGFGKSFS